MGHTCPQLLHNFPSTILQRESYSSLRLSNGYIIYTPGPTPGGLHILLSPSVLNINWMHNQSWRRTFIYSPLVGILPQFGRTNVGRLRLDWSQVCTNIYPLSDMISPLFGRKGAGIIQFPGTQMTGTNCLQKRGTPSPSPEGGVPGKNVVASPHTLPNRMVPLAKFPRPTPPPEIPTPPHAIENGGNP